MEIATDLCVGTAAMLGSWSPPGHYYALATLDRCAFYSPAWRPLFHLSFRKSLVPTSTFLNPSSPSIKHTFQTTFFLVIWVHLINLFSVKLSYLAIAAVPPQTTPKIERLKTTLFAHNSLGWQLEKRSAGLARPSVCGWGLSRACSLWLGASWLRTALLTHRSKASIVLIGTNR